MSPPVLLDSSFIIALEREATLRRRGPAQRFLGRLRGRKLVISVVTVEEILEGSTAPEATLAALQRFTVQGLHLAHAHRCSLLQSRAVRRMGENDAWLVATADLLAADVVGDDRVAFERLGDRYLRFR